MSKVLLHLAYDGAAYDGWQSQPSGRGVQDQVENALTQIFQQKLRLEGASRTDAGVHAHAMPAHFEIGEGARMPPLRQLPLALNRFLPEDVRVVSAQAIPSTFHARFDAVGKTYAYRIWNHPAMHPLHRHYAWHIPTPLNVSAMRKAAKLLVGTHDFFAFTVTCPGELKDSVRTLHRCEILDATPELQILIEGSSFLYKMGRALAGLLVQVGQGKRLPEEIPLLFEGARPSPDQRSGVIAPAHGLALLEVNYPFPIGAVA
nr:tRNA pseudouridine(38-40) synthase TruA [Haloferula luteola]